MPLAFTQEDFLVFPVLKITYCTCVVKLAIDRVKKFNKFKLSNASNTLRSKRRYSF